MTETQAFALFALAAVLFLAFRFLILEYFKINSRKILMEKQLAATEQTNELLLAITDRLPPQPAPAPSFLRGDGVEGGIEGGIDWTKQLEEQAE